MNGKDQALEKAKQFLMGNQKGVLITGPHQYKKHILAMAAIEKCYKNSLILVRTNSMNNITNREFFGKVGIMKQPKVGEQIKIGNNYYEFDTFNNRGTWYKTSNQFDFALVYPIDYLARESKTEPIEDIVEHKGIKKLFLCSWTDTTNSTYSMFDDYFQEHIIYDAEEEDPAYHKRVLGCE